MSLFNNNEEKLNLYKAVDNIKDRFGNKAIAKAAASSSSKRNKKDTFNGDVNRSVE
jgi:DNA polymerase-4